MYTYKCMHAQTEADIDKCTHAQTHRHIHTTHTPHTTHATHTHLELLLAIRLFVQQKHIPAILVEV